MTNPGDRRSLLEIVADILRVLRLGTVSVIEIAHTSGINKEQALKYLDRLIGAGAVEDAGLRMDLPSYRITSRGLMLLNHIEELRELLPPEQGLDILRKSRIVNMNVGQILVSGGIAARARQDAGFAAFVEESLARYRQGDWGDSSAEDRQTLSAHAEKSRLVQSSYESPGYPELWITTTADRSFTTILFPEEYGSLEAPQPFWLERDIRTTQ